MGSCEILAFDAATQHRLSAKKSQHPARIDSTGGRNWFRYQHPALGCIRIFQNTLAIFDVTISEENIVMTPLLIILWRSWNIPVTNNVVGCMVIGFKVHHVCNKLAASSVRECFCPQNPWVSIGNSPFQLKLLTFHRKPSHWDTFQLHHFKHLSNVESLHTPFSLTKNFNTAHQSHPSPMHLQFRQAPRPRHRWQQGPQAPWSKDGFGSVMWKSGRIPNEFTLPETNIAPQNGWLEDGILVLFLGFGLFSGAKMWVSGRVIVDYDLLSLDLSGTPKTIQNHHEPWTQFSPLAMDKQKALQVQYVWTCIIMF